MFQNAHWSCAPPQFCWKQTNLYQKFYHVRDSQNTETSNSMHRNHKQTDKECDDTELKIHTDIHVFNN